MREETKVKIALEAIREELDEAWHSGLRQKDIRLGDIHKKLNWKNNQHTVGEALVRLYEIFNNDGEEYQCSCEIIHFPEWRSSLQNLYGMSLIIRFKFPPSHIDIHKLLFSEYDKNFKKLSETIIVLERCIYEMNKQKDKTKISECNKVFSDYLKKHQFQLQEIERHTQLIKEQIEELKARLRHEEK